MRHILFPVLAGLLIAPAVSLATQDDSKGPYRVTQSSKVGGDGGFDYIYADASGRKLYIARTGPTPRMTIFDLDTLAPAGEIPNTSAHGAAVDKKTHHGFATSKPIAMWDSKTLKPIKTIDVDGRPDGLLNDEFNHRTYIFSHQAPNATVIDDSTGTVLGTIDLGGAPEQAASDGKGTLFVDVEDKGAVAVIDAKTMKLKTTYSLNGKGDGCAGLALDVKNHVLFVACREPQVMVMLDSRTGKYLSDLPLAGGSDGAVFNPKTGECFSSHGNGTLSIIKEVSPTQFVIEQTLNTMMGAKTCTLDSKTGHIYVMAAEYGPAPESGATPPAEGRRPRRPMIPNSFTILVIGK